VTLGPTRP